MLELRNFCQRSLDDGRRLRSLCFPSCPPLIRLVCLLQCPSQFACHRRPECQQNLVRYRQVESDGRSEHDEGDLVPNDWWDRSPRVHQPPHPNTKVWTGPDQERLRGSQLYRRVSRMRTCGVQARTRLKTPTYSHQPDPTPHIHTHTHTHIRRFTSTCAYT